MTADTTEPIGTTTDSGSVSREGFDLSSIQMEATDEELRVPKPKRGKRESVDKDSPDIAAPKHAPPYREGQFIKPLTQLYGWFAVGLSPFDENCATVLAEQGESCAKAWDALAKRNVAVRRMLQTLVEGGAWSGVIMAHMPIMVAVASHHAPDRMPAIFRQMQENEQPEEEPVA